MNDPGQLQRLEAIAEELIRVFNIHAPPVPIETILQHPHEGLWETVDVNQLSSTFLNIKEQFSPRMSLARLLARHVALSAWGESRGLKTLLEANDENVRAFARMLIMPREMIDTLTPSTRNASAINLEFEVPEEDARLRLNDLFG